MITINLNEFNTTQKTDSHTSFLILKNDLITCYLQEAPFKQEEIERIGKGNLAIIQNPKENWNCTLNI